MAPNLRTLIPSILSLTALSSSVACSSETSMDSEVACPSTGDDRYKSLSPSPKIDSISFYARTRANVTRLRMAIGTTCKRAGDTSACRARVEAMVATNESGWYSDNFVEGGGARDFAIVTQGDDVRLVDRPYDLAMAVAPIDSAEEAVALVRVSYAPSTVCGAPNVTRDAQAYVVKSVSDDACENTWETLFSVTQGGIVKVGEPKLLTSGLVTPCASGRKPAMLVETPSPWLRTLGDHFAEVSHMEAAAVLAFEDIERHLRRFGAPEALLARVRQARADEVRHAARTRALAERFGGSVRDPRCGLRDVQPSLLTFAVENAREGCVRETYGALVAAYQAEHAADPEVRSVLGEIRSEELEHAELSWDIADWAEARLTVRERATVHHARREAIEELRTALAEEPSQQVRDVAGMPDAQTAQFLLDKLAPSVMTCAA